MNSLNRLRKWTRIFRSATNAHQYAYCLNGRFHLVETTAQEPTNWLAQLFSALAALFASALSVQGRVAVLTITAALLASSGSALAGTNLPTGFDASQSTGFSAPVISGGGTVANITTTGAKSVGSFHTFDTAVGHTINIDQTFGTTAKALIRVRSGNPTEMLGTLNSNGSVFIMNPAGVFVGESSVLLTLLGS